MRCHDGDPLRSEVLHRDILAFDLSLSHKAHTPPTPLRDRMCRQTNPGSEVRTAKPEPLFQLLTLLNLSQVCHPVVAQAQFFF